MKLKAWKLLFELYGEISNYLKLGEKGCISTQII